MITNFKIFEQSGLEPNEEIIATNKSYWSWEYDAHTVTANIILDNADDSLYLKITKTHTKSGLGAGKFTTELVNMKIGDTRKADLGTVRSLLKKYGMDQVKFSKHWEDDEGNKMSLTDLLSIYKPKKETNPKKIENIKTYKPKRISKKDIDLVKYSDRAYALFGDGTKEIKGELSKIGGRYNRYLTDPRTKEKRAGWIFSVTKLDKIKKYTE